MGMKELEAALRLIAERPELSDFAGPRPERLVDAAETTLGLRLPPTYRHFVQTLGAGGFGAEEIYGIVDDNFTDSTIPNGIWLTLKHRKTSHLPDSMVMIYSDGTGSYFALDTNKRNEDGESPVMVWQPGASRPGDKLEIVAPDFGSFFLARLRTEL